MYVVVVEERGVFNSNAYRVKKAFECSVDGSDYSVGRRIKKKKKKIRHTSYFHMDNNYQERIVAIDLRLVSLSLQHPLSLTFFFLSSSFFSLPSLLYNTNRQHASQKAGRAAQEEEAHGRGQGMSIYI